MDERRDRSGTGHGVGQPHEQRQLRRFPGGSGKQQQRDDKCDHGRKRRRSGVYGLETEARSAAVGKCQVENESAQYEGRITDAVDDKGLASGRGLLMVGVPETD